MPLADKLKAANDSYRDTFICKLMHAVASPKLSKEDAEAVLAAINSGPLDLSYIPARQLAKALREEGFDISPSAVDRHRRGDCSCNRLK